MHTHTPPHHTEHTHTHTDTHTHTHTHTPLTSRDLSTRGDGNPMRVSTSSMGLSMQVRASLFCVVYTGATMPQTKCNCASMHAHARAQASCALAEKVSIMRLFSVSFACPAQKLVLCSVLTRNAQGWLEPCRGGWLEPCWGACTEVFIELQLWYTKWHGVCTYAYTWKHIHIYKWQGVCDAYTWKHIHIYI